jgi:hypothetical protein
VHVAPAVLVEPVKPIEPVELLHRMRHLAAGEPARARAVLPSAVASVVYGELSAADEVSPAARRQIEVVCENYARELWLWLAGERTWAQCSAGLYGRIARRATV